jgi:hypothetical protein
MIKMVLFSHVQLFWSKNLITSAIVVHDITIHDNLVHGLKQFFSRSLQLPMTQCCHALLLSYFRTAFLHDILQINIFKLNCLPCSRITWNFAACDSLILVCRWRHFGVWSGAAENWTQGRIVITSMWEQRLCPFYLQEKYGCLCFNYCLIWNVLQVFVTLASYLNFSILLFWKRSIQLLFIEVIFFCVKCGS